MCLIEMECVESGPKRQKRAVISLLAVALRLTLLSGAEIQGKEKAEDKRGERNERSCEDSSKRELQIGRQRMKQKQSRDRRDEAGLHPSHSLIAPNIHPF